MAKHVKDNKKVQWDMLKINMTKRLMLLMLVWGGYAFAMENEIEPQNVEKIQDAGTKNTLTPGTKKAKFSEQLSTFENVHSYEGCGTLFT